MFDLRDASTPVARMFAVLANSKLGVSASAFFTESEGSRSSMTHPGDELLTPASKAWFEAVDAAQRAHLASVDALSITDRVVAKVGAALWEARDRPPGRPIHVRADHHLVAVLNTQTLQVALRAELKPSDLLRLSAVVMPAAAARAPPGFVSRPLWDLLWQSAQTDPEIAAAMPHGVATQKLHLRRLPRVSAHLVVPRHDLLLRALTKNNLTFEALVQTLPVSAGDLSHDVAALYVTRSLVLA